MAHGTPFKSALLQISVSCAYSFPYKQIRIMLAKDRKMKQSRWFMLRFRFVTVSSALCLEILMKRHKFAREILNRMRKNYSQM